MRLNSSTPLALKLQYASDHLEFCLKTDWSDVSRQGPRNSISNKFLDNANAVDQSGNHTPRTITVLIIFFHSN